MLIMDLHTRDPCCIHLAGGVIYAALCVVWELVMNREK